jgi:DnaJ-class molecular chaperone
MIHCFDTTVGMVLGGAIVIHWRELEQDPDLEPPRQVEWVELQVTPDPYRHLGIRPTATADEIRRAYWKLAALFHPDHQSNDLKPAAEARMKELNAAYALLRHSKRRAADDAELSGKSYA